jgi:signal transduction histidine kinase
MVWNWLRRHPALVDGLLAAVIGAIYVADAVYHHRYVLGLALAVLQTLPLLVRRRWPLAVLALVTLGALAAAIAYRTFIPLSGAVAVYTVAVYESRRRSAWATAAALGTMVAAAIRSTDYASLVVFVAAWILGENLRTRRAYLNELEEKADRLEREREANIRRAAAEEQARIARELHDVIAHNVSVMTVQASAAGDVFDSDPARAREALRAIESTGRAALTELRRLLAVDRYGSRAELVPQPGLGALDELVGQVRAAGLDVELTIEGGHQSLPPALDLSAYRIVQEAMTNTLKHAAARHVWVDVSYGDDEVGISVRDDGIGPTELNGASGRGLIGMRERVELFGGSLDVGPSPGGGYAVLARFPVTGE